MAAIALEGIGKVYAGSDCAVIENLNLEVREGEFMVFVGPSGCGKTTLLRMIAGLEDITSGSLRFDGERVNDAAPAQRGAAMVFQSYALYPHMTVAENLAFSLKLAGVPTSERELSVRKVADVLQITNLLERKPKALSGGQRQRVAIGRAIIRQPKVFLFDEPLSNLDANLRVQMRMELARLHQRLGCTMVYVTHDQVEAMTLGQRIAVFNKGRIEQVGTPLQVYHEPANTFVAEFLGSPRMNLIPVVGVLRNAQGHPCADLGSAGCLPLDEIDAPMPATTPRTVGVRPEHFEVAPAGCGLQVHVSLVEQLGECTVVYFRLQGVEQDYAMKLNGSITAVRNGQMLSISASPQHLRWFDDLGVAVVR